MADVRMMDDPSIDATGSNTFGSSVIVAPVNLYTDLAHSIALRTTAALRIADHHVSTRANIFLGSDMELFCVSQVCITYPVSDLKEQLKYFVHKDGLIPILSEMWVQGLGRTSITFGHKITFRGKPLAAITRVNVRQNSKTGDLVEVSEEERASGFPASPRRVGIPEVPRLDVPSKHDMELAFTVCIGPHHCNNQHVDHAALADLILQGIAIRGDPFEMQRLSIRYLSPVKLNQTLSCFVHKKRALAALYGQSFDTTPLVVGEILSNSKLSML